VGAKEQSGRTWSSLYLNSRDTVYDIGAENVRKVWTRLSTILQCIGCVVALRINSLVITLYITKVYSLMVVV
jgi:hypothetical protein